ncbi:MAG TPA: class I SAM-dependent methyltransferase [Myxococcales bacterium]|nr:class I SAM-dependent methyltransferase [Myxococcales bacterium]
MAAIVTTAPSGSPEEADDLARRFGLEARPRQGRPLHEILADASPRPVLVLAEKRADLYDGNLSYRASAGLAFLRLLRTRHGPPDPLVAAADLKPGERVLDATLGLAGDALLAAQATGTTVVGLEQSGLRAAFTQAGLTRLPGHGREPGRLIEVRHEDHRSFLKAQEAGSFDVVLLDPMFRVKGDAGPLFDLLRAHADHEPLTLETLNEARRVAKRGVLIKDHARGAELQRLGLTPRLSRRMAVIAFGWADSLIPR